MRKEKNMISNCHIHSDIDSDCLLCLSDPDEVDVITDHLPEPKCGMDELVESLSDKEAEYWEMKAEVYFGL
jgi:hypothetical protein